ncbi:alpha/beta fold hydrolase [Corynebacterium sp.]|uniref:bifunctional alpha/beta hydrolase/OsmC family protein n=1 Tax=Corynebacterium sp. TaxID=1720 RepID=UPI0026DFBEA9|nr:alpha/beta fold hydrolase [Corynebacterium sp.]MDO5511551.1 alpha/beta fold hydrolase [Corynebacterium sp.]
MQSVSVTFPSAQGIELPGTLDLPDTPPVAYAVFAHCFTCSRFVPAASRVCKTLAAAGIACLRFDFSELGFTSNVEELVAAAEWLAAKHEAPQLLLGHSLGGAVALRAVSEIDSVRAVATLAAPYDPSHSVLRFGDRVRDAETEGSVTVTLAGRDVDITREFLADLSAHGPDTYLPQVSTPVLLLHSPDDQTVPFDNAERIYRELGQPTSLISLDGADHLLTRTGSAQRAGRLIAEWVRPYLVPSYEAPSVSDDRVISRMTVGSRHGTVIDTAGGTLLSDRDRAAGGRGQGHSPISLLMSGLAAATTQAIREAAVDMPLIDAHVTITHASRNIFERKVKLIGDLSEPQRRTLLNAATSPFQIMLPGIKILDVPA